MSAPSWRIEQHRLASDARQFGLWCMANDSSGVLIRALLANYDKIDPVVKAELPLKRFWMVAADEDLD